MNIVFVIDTYSKNSIFSKKKGKKELADTPPSRKAKRSAEPPFALPAEAEKLHDLLTAAGHTVSVIGLGAPDSPCKMKKRFIPIFSFVMRLHGISPAKTKMISVDDALEGVDIVHSFLPLSLGKKIEFRSRILGVPVLASCPMTAKQYLKMVGFSWFPALTPLVKKILQFSFFGCYKNILCHSPEIMAELEQAEYPQRLHSFDRDNDSDDEILDTLTSAYEQAIKDDLITYEDKNRQIFRRNWAFMPSSVDLKNIYKKKNIFGRANNFIWYSLVVVLTWIVGGLWFGLRVKGRKNLRSLKGGAFSVSNHIHVIDGPFIAAITASRRVTFTSMEGNFRIPISRWIIKWIGVVPIPTSNKLLAGFFKQTVASAASGHIIHFYPEASMWQYAHTLRPFKKGAFRMAVDAGVPVLPIVLGLRPPKGLYRLFKKKPLFTANILPPVYPDETLTGKKKINEFMAHTHEQMTTALLAFQEKHPKKTLG